MNLPREDVLLEALAGPGWYVDPAFLSEDQTRLLREECLAAWRQGGFHAAGTGRGQAHIDGEIRGDLIQWVDRAQAGPVLAETLDALETLRQAVNRSLFLGLFDAELHFAAYPPGAGYQRHLDRFRDDDRRTLTTIVYLNEPGWCEADGGLLRFWPEEQGAPLDILPSGGTLVTFLSARFWHQVLPAQRQRLSLTGWFRRR